MQYKNAKTNADGSFDCEINHPLYGWIPFTARRGDKGAQFDVEAMLDMIEVDPATAAYVPPTEQEITEAQALELEERRSGMNLSFAQLLIGLVSEQWLSESDGELWLEGKLPTQVLDVINTLPEANRFAAKAKAIRPSVVIRNDPLVNALAAAQNKTAEEIDTFFLTYSEN